MTRMHTSRLAGSRWNGHRCDHNIPGLSFLDKYPAHTVREEKQRRASRVPDHDRLPLTLVDAGNGKRERFLRTAISRYLTFGDIACVLMLEDAINRDRIKRPRSFRILLAATEHHGNQYGLAHCSGPVQWCVVV